MARNDILARLAVMISANTAELNKGMAAATKSLNAFEKTATGVSNQLKGAIGAVSFGLIAKQVIDVTSEFQKFEAVLTNTLGSNSAAQKALTQIKDFAAATPFSVQELTASFVKLANQGFIPTTGELKKLGDLASSTGKSFDQLTEAIIDAQTGEFERLKEFGIRASKSGDQVKFTFKGVQTQTKFTADSIRDYILSLGELEGVSGSMAAISQTLGGRISNLGDAFDSLLLAIGNSSSGPLNAAIESLIKLTNAAANLGDELSLTAVGLGLKSFNSVADTTLDYLLKFGRANSGKAIAEILEPITNQGNQQFLQNFNKNLQDFTNILKKEGEDVGEIATLWDHYVKKRREAAAADKDAALQAMTDAVLAAKTQAEEYAKYLASLGLIEKITIKIDELEKAKKGAFSIEEVASFNDQIKNLRDELELLNAAHKLSGFGKRIFADSEAGLPSDLNIKTQDNRKPADNPFKLPKVEAPDVSPIIYAWQLLDKKFQETGVIASDSLAKIATDLQTTGQANFDNIAQQIQAQELLNQKLDEEAKLRENMRNAILDLGSDISSSIQQSISANETFAQSLARLAKQVVAARLAMALANAISKSFETAKNPIVGAVLAGVASAGVMALFSKIPSQFRSSGGGGGGGSSTTSNISMPRLQPTSTNSDISFNAEFEIRGDSLVAVANTQDYKNGRLG